MIKKLFKKIGYLFINCYSIIAGVFLGRSKKYVLVGSWGGNKIADNSRYLFQFLSLNKSKLGLKKVIWATRNQRVLEMLRGKGHDAVLIGTKESKKWHLKSGIHILCNMYLSVGSFQPDIDVKYSCGAKKVQLWHGVGPKAVGKDSNLFKSKKQNLFNRAFSKVFSCSCFSLGAWKNMYFLTTSQLNKEVNFRSIDCKYKRMFISSYPRSCECLELFDNENDVIQQIKKYKYFILYLPTFRSGDSIVKSPVQDATFVNYLEKNNIIFVEKAHSAAKSTLIDVHSDNVLSLNSDFDINVLIDIVSCVITDYSSVGFDAIHKKKPVIFYTPDIDEYKNSDNGLILDMEKVFDGILVKDINEIVIIFNKLINNNYFDEKTIKSFDKVDDDFFSLSQKDYIVIWNDIMNAIKGKKQKVNG